MPSRYAHGVEGDEWWKLTRGAAVVEPFTFTGSWWFPSRPDVSLSGSLSYGETGELVWEPEEYLFKGAVGLGTKYGQENIPLYKHEVVHGRCPERGAITLFGCRQMAQLGSSYRVDIAIFGAHVMSHESLRLQRLSFYPLHLDIWMAGECDDGGSCASFGFDDACVIPRPKGSSDDVSARKLKVSLRPFPRAAHNPGEGTLPYREHQVAMEYERATYAEYRYLIRRLRDFLTFAMMTPAYPQVILSDYAGGSGSGSEAACIEIMDSTLLRPAKAKALKRDSMLFTSGDTHGKLPGLVQRWLSMVCCKRFGVAIDLYLGTLYYREGLGVFENDFLDLVTAVEAYYNRVCHKDLPQYYDFENDAAYSDNAVLPEDEFEQVKKALKEACPEQHRGWLSSKLHNYPSLRNKLLYLFKDQRDYWPECTDVKLKITSIVKMRNALVHGREGASSDMSALAEAKEDLRLLLCTAFLQELGFDSADMWRMSARVHDTRAYLATYL